MAIKNGIRTLLLAQSSITTLCPAQTVDGTNHDAIFVGQIPQGVKPPYIRIVRRKHDPMKCLDGTTGMAKTWFDFSCTAYTVTKAEAIAKAVSDFFKDYSGAAGASDTIDAVNWEGQTDDELPEGDGDDRARYMVILEFLVLHH